MKLTKRALTGVLLSAALAFSAGAFAKSGTYTPGQFTDVPASEWYSSDVGSAYELGLMNGVGGGLFEPDGNVTVAEAITMAARASAIHAGETIDTSAAGEWYTPYVNYAIGKGFVAQGQFDNYDRPAKRYEVATLFENAMPDGYFTAQNTVETIPDVSEKQPYQADLLTLYRAGIVMGSDSYGNFFPENNITRAEAAAIINRVALPENRLSKTLDKISADDAYLLVTSRYAHLNDNVTGIRSGWSYDMRGSAPQESYIGNYAGLADISDTEGTAFIRELSTVTTGKVVLQTSVALTKDSDGVYVEYQNDAGDTVYRIETVDGAWKQLQADGSYVTLCELGDGTVNYALQAEIDLDNHRATTYINYTDCGTYALCTPADKTELSSYRIATTAKSKASVQIGLIKMTVNYGVYEMFDFGPNAVFAASGSGVPFDWTGSEQAYVSGSALYMPANTSASKMFSPVSGKVIAEFIVLLPNAESVSYTLKSGAKNIVSFTTDEKNFYVNGEKVYEDYYANLWYRLRFELDTDEQTMLVKVNGRNAATLAFGDAATSVDNFVIANSDDTEVRFDTFKVYRYIEHEDYVPVPVVPAGEEDYIVGMNVCSLWVNDLHNGWDCVTPYDDITPVLGYYDELNPETADWEIKYLVEHGIDFQAFCLYFNTSNGVLNLDNERNHLFNGFMNAKYSDMSKFAMLWEAGNAQSPSNMDTWKKDWVPYFIENFFKDDRYMVIDNKPILLVFGVEKLAQRAGGTSVVKQMFDYLEEEVKTLGFDGMIYVANNVSPSSDVTAMGFDVTSAYNWSVAGYSLEVNKSSNTTNAKNAEKLGMYTIPTISVGFNNIGWNASGARHPMMTMEDYAAAQKWVKDEYLPTYAKEDWQKNFVMLSTWNEYGEGTYIMPTADERGFGYLDVLREAYTDEKADASLNTVPTAAQRARINRLFPQDRTLLRREGYESGVASADELEVLFTLNYNSKNGLGVSNIKEIDFNDELGAHGVSGGDALIDRSVSGFDRKLNEVPVIRVTCQAKKGEKLQMFFRTSAENNYNEAKSFIWSSTSDEMTEYVIYTNSNAMWKGVLTGVRVDPVDGADKTFAFKSIEFLGQNESFSKTMRINGREFSNAFAPRFAENGAVVLAFDPGISMDFRLGAVYNWDKANGVLTLNFKKNHTVVYTVGSNQYIFDGTAKSLGFTLDSIDGLPLIPIEMLCKDLGFKYSVTDKGVIEIETDDLWYFEQIDNRVPGEWDFNLLGDSEGWTSGFMSLAVGTDGYMSAVSLSDSTDPTIVNSKASLIAEKYTKLEYRVRYEWVKSYKDDPNQMLTMYFITNVDQNWNEAKTLKVALNGQSSNGEWQVYSVDTASNPLWKDTITSLRFDPFNAVGSIDIDYIHFIADPDYLEPGERPFAIVNGDAEDTSKVAFSDSKNRMKIVEDPDKPGNHCYMLLCDDIQIWLYARQKCTFKPGATYKVEMDVRIAAHGTDTDLDPSFKGVILANMQYADPDAASADHIVDRISVTPAEGWKHFTFEFTVNPDSTDRSKDMFTLYSDPVNDIGVGYYFDNIVVEEILPED